MVLYNIKFEDKRFLGLQNYLVRQSSETGINARPVCFGKTEMYLLVGFISAENTYVVKFIFSTFYYGEENWSHESGVDSCYFGHFFK